MQNSINRLQERNRNIVIPEQREEPKDEKSQIIYINPYQNQFQQEPQEDSEDDDYVENSPPKMVEKKKRRKPEIDSEREEIYKENMLLREQLTRQVRDYERMELDLEKKTKEIEQESENTLKSKIRELESENARLKGQVEYIVRINTNSFLERSFF